MTNSSPLHEHACAFPDPRGPFRFVRLNSVGEGSILAHLSDARIARHLPLLPAEPDAALVRKMIASKEECWMRDGLGHWAILYEDEYAGFGGFQREQENWDFGLVLRHDHFRRGRTIASLMFDWARRNTDIETATFLLPLSRSERALSRFGALPTGQIEISGVPFCRWSLSLHAFRDTASSR